MISVYVIILVLNTLGQFLPRYTNITNLATRILIDVKYSNCLWFVFTNTANLYIVLKILLLGLLWWRESRFRLGFVFFQLHKFAKLRNIFRHRYVINYTIAT